MQITSAVVSDFRTFLNGQFGDKTKWPDDIIVDVLCEADAETGGSGWGVFALDCDNFKRRGMYLFAAHWLTFFYGDSPANGVGGIARLNTQSKSVADESISYRVASMMDAGNDALTYTVYGQQFYRLRRRAGMGGEGYLMTKSATVEVRASVRWWVKWYLSGVAAMSRATGLEPNWDRVAGWIMRGIKVEVKK